ncbi:hypothetical protein ACE4RV_08330 [Acetobacter persici]|uniref:hypothetical protein n=1 Tax=Acetobacter persici TaxID=1076596 RepID=UPI0036DBC67A
MDYEKIEQYIYEINSSTYDILNALTPFYRYKLYQKIKENSRLNEDCSPEILADGIVNTLSHMKKDVLDSFELASHSYKELLQVQRITKTRLTRKANRYRINLRRILGLSRDDDEVQSSFDNDKKARYQKIKFNGYSVQDSIEKKIKNNRSRDWSISQCLNESSKILGMKQTYGESGWFMTLTLPAKFRNMSFEQCNDEINRRINMIKKYTERLGILWTAIYAVELHKDETPHIHIIYYVNDYNSMNEAGYGWERVKTDRDKLLDIVFRFFDNENDARQNDNFTIENNQEIYSFDKCLGYLFKDYGKPNVRHGFIGLRRDIKNVWNALYGGDIENSCLSYLSNRKLFLSITLMYMQDIDDYLYGYPAFTLFAISGFKSGKINELANRNIDLDDTQFSMYQHELQKMRNYVNPPRQKSDKKYKKVRKTFIKSGYVLVFGNVYLYINTKIVFDYQCEKSKGQPPPSGEGKGLFI